MGKYTMEQHRDFYNKHLGKKVKIITKTGEVDGRIDKVRIDLPDEQDKCYIYVRGMDGYLHKVDHDDVVEVR